MKPITINAPPVERAGPLWVECKAWRAAIRPAYAATARAMRDGDTDAVAAVVITSAGRPGGPMLATLSAMDLARLLRCPTCGGTHCQRRGKNDR